MKYIALIFALCFSTIALGQLKGDGNIITKTFEVDNIKSVKINLYAKITIDCEMKNSLRINADSNLMDKIYKTITNGVLELNQKEWIKASKKIEITIGAPYLSKIELGTNDATYIENFKNDSLKIIAPIGKLTINGTSSFLDIEAKNGIIDATSLFTKDAKISITGRSKTTVNVTNKITTSLSKNAQLKLASKPLIIEGDLRDYETTKPKVDNSVKWINFKLKNNSWNRQKLFVIGPKKDGSTFSYGFAMMPGVTRNERWTIGTKIYTNRPLGKKKLLVTITEDNENEVVKLF